MAGTVEISSRFLACNGERIVVILGVPRYQVTESNSSPNKKQDSYFGRMTRAEG
jgi:hypothetical protein